MGFSSVIKWHYLHKPFSFLVVLLWVLKAVVLAVDSDKSVLLEFKSSLSDPLGLLSSWNSESPDHCSWNGVLCDSNSRVLALNISGSRTEGNSSPYACYFLARFPLSGFGIRRNCAGLGGRLAGKLLPHIAKLTELRVLSLPNNELGGEIPRAILQMEKLEVLDIEGNLLSGSLPTSFSGLRKLRVLNLGFNRIEGGLPASLANCVCLEILNLAGNKFNGTIPKFIGKLKELKGVYLSFNQLDGLVPSEIGNGCEKLEHLDLSANSFLGEIPSSFGNCVQLKTLLLYSNMFLEGIPADFGRLKMLQVLDVSRNSLSGPIPLELGNCSELSVLVFSNLFDPLPSDHLREGDSSLSPMNRAGGEYNYFEGEIPSQITALPKLRILWAPRANLEGSLPSNWASCNTLEMINLAQNLLSGKILEGFLHCKKLHFLDLSSNRLSGELDDKLPVPCMTLFDISNNDMSGRIPAFYGSSCLQLPALKESLIEMDTPSSTYMSYFSYKAHVGILLPSSRGNEELMVYHNFGSNKFTGTIQSVPIVPFRLRRKAVYAFIAGNNRLTGPFPGNLFQSCNAFDGLIVNVSNNRISGQIPGDIASKCRNVIILDASGNQINGSLSDSFEKMTSLVALNLSSNLLEGEIPTSLGLLKGLKYLSLAYNDLTGSIPSSFRLLRSLEVLELFSNSLTGEIPKGLENLSNLSVLLLNNNNLFGQIPSGLANVTTLSAFNVSFNNLSGPWPLSGNFTGCDSVLGNPLYRYCHMLSPTLPTSEEHGSIEGAQSYTASPSESPTDGKGGLNPIEIASITSASAIFSVLMVLIVLFIYTRKCNPKSNILRSAKKEVIVFNDIGVQLTFENAVRATANFNASNCIGSGGFGTTYKAEISPGVLVAIKRLAVGRFQGVQQFHAEIKTLGRLHHPNLVTLIGYHASETEMFLIYNYLPGGNLEKFIKERSTRAVDWRVLHKIALDIARALAYLHDQCVPRVLHRDVKPSNILLDEDFNAYLSDFGLARLLGTSETHATTGVAGTVGYVAPEYAMTCRVSDKADVYSYGVVLLELLSDKKALDPSFSSYENGFNIVAWGCMLLRQGSAKEFFTAGLWDAGPHDDLVEILHLAVVCTVESLSTRPTMRQVVRRLKQLQPPSC